MEESLADSLADGESSILEMPTRLRRYVCRTRCNVLDLRGWISVFHFGDCRCWLDSNRRRVERALKEAAYARDRWQKAAFRRLERTV
jgi:hypothetical protein